MEVTVETCFPVSFTEIDILGIVHHSNYVRWFEAGRMNYFKKAGNPVSRINSIGLYLPLLEMECEFKSPAKFGDVVQILTKLVYVTCVKVKFEYQVVNKTKGKVLAVGRTTHAWTNRKLELQNMEKTSPEIYSQLKQLAGKTDAV